MQIQFEFIKCFGGDMMVALRRLGTAFGDDVYDENMRGNWCVHHVLQLEIMLPNICDEEEIYCNETRAM